MNKELKVGMYVRTKEGYICKILKLNETYEDDGYLDHNDIRSASIQEKNVIKSSHNLIDLIEVGDYVNGQRVNYINKDRKNFNISFGSIDYNLKSKFNDDIKWLSVDEIKSIVTKEQFKSLEYEV